MGKSIFYRLFRLGALPRNVRAEIEAEGIVVLDEGIGGWLVERNVRAPWRWSLYRIQGFTGFLAVTKKRVLAQGFRTRLIDIPTGDSRLTSLHAAFPKAGRLTLSFDYAVFLPGSRGQVELRFNTEKASAFYDALTALGVQADGAGLSVRRGLR